MAFIMLRQLTVMLCICGESPFGSRMRRLRDTMVEGSFVPDVVRVDGFWLTAFYRIQKKMKIDGLNL